MKDTVTAATHVRPAGLTLAQHAYFVIQERILKGDFPLGAPLSRRRLATELGMSLIPVNEALQSLENDGLVESRPRVGTRVCQPSAQEIRDRYQVREALETQVARLFAERASPAARIQLLGMAKDLDAMFGNIAAPPAAGREFLFSVHSLHRRFHLHIAESTGCNALCNAIEHNHVLVFNWLYDISAQRPALPPHFHQSLVEALNSGDVDVADAAMRAHIRQGLETVLEEIGSPIQSTSFERVK